MQQLQMSPLQELTSLVKVLLELAGYKLRARSR